jgi:type IV secretion system protein VirD4
VLRAIMDISARALSLPDRPQSGPFGSPGWNDGETARPLLTPGEVMQLPPSDELVLVSGIPPIRARKARYYEDQRLTSRILDPPVLTAPGAGHSGGRRLPTADDWTPLPNPDPGTATEDEAAAGSLTDHDRANSGIRRERTLPSHEAIVREEPAHKAQFAFDDEADDDPIPAQALHSRLQTVARQAALDPGDGLSM